MHSPVDLVVSNDISGGQDEEETQKQIKLGESGEENGGGRYGEGTWGMLVDNVALTMLVWYAGLKYTPFPYARPFKILL